MLITRFAPSPTGLLHIGNARTALVNYLFTRKHGGKFMLRIDDTDLVRSKQEYEDAIIKDLKWLGIKWEIFAKQSDRLDRYDLVKNLLIEKGRLYECYESAEEIEVKRKLLLSRGMPPIYDRTSLKLTQAQKDQFKKEGKKPHYRFQLFDRPIKWQDLVRGDVTFDGAKLSDPILIREDGSMTYILTSVVDDIDFNITNIVRGEDHVTNTAIQIQIFQALEAKIPIFAHLNLIKTKDALMSKRDGGFDIKSLCEEGIEPLAIECLLAKLGTSMAVEPKSSLDELIKEFDISKYGRAPANYDKSDLARLNHKIIFHMELAQLNKRLKELEINDIDEDFWQIVKGNLNKLSDIKIWWKICKEPIEPIIEDKELLNMAIELFPQGDIDDSSWGIWTKLIASKSGKNGKALFMPLRCALTAMEHGPELKYLLPLIGREKALKRLAGEAA
jgi:glutamyl-tRNA synthetase